MAVKVEESDWKRKKKRKSFHNEPKLLKKDDEGGVMRDDEPDCGRERTGKKRKLAVGEEVEVRSVEDGLLGSWHSGTIIGCDYFVRDVQYEMLDDKTGESLVESLDVSCAIEGTSNSIVDTNQCNYRGKIRPLPPHLDFGKWNLHYGLCVDVLFLGAWWEGVIFDHEDGLENRKIFFPDLGDELTVGVDNIRITQDWNEVTGTWERRQNWLFLELIEEYEQDWPLNVSVKQIWYDVRGKKGFVKVEDWTFQSDPLWRELVQEALADNFRITLNKICCMLKPEVLGNCHAAEPVGSTSPLDGDMMIINGDANAKDSVDGSVRFADKLVENGGLDASFQYTNKKSSNQPVLKNHHEQGAISFVENGGLDMSCQDPVMSVQPQALLIEPSKPNEKPQASEGKYIVDIDGEYCPQAVEQYYFHGLDRKDAVQGSYLKSKAKKHLSFMGWTIGLSTRRGRRDMHYLSPKGKSYYSLRRACKGCMDERRASEGTSTTYDAVKIINVNEKVEGQESSSALTDTRIQNSLTEQNRPSAKLKSKRISVVTKKRHDRLHGVNTHSLQWLTQSYGKDGFGIGLIDNREFRHPVGKNVCFSTLNNGKGSKDLMKLKGLDGSRVLRSRKRARPVQLPGSANNTRTILSWLIDNNVVLPRAKVHYSSRKDHHPMAEGQITHDGIKCSCCREVFSLNRFAAHAGSSYRRSAANIFLEDGRSLLECQMQVIRDITGKGFKKESCSRKKSSKLHHENDYICSVCCYGGDLVLCDQCPSSFHKSCLGLKTLPEGDWFCPPCCCGICGENKFYGDGEQDDAVFSCYQCEHKYHVGCLWRKWGHVKLERYPEGTWFCSKQCKKIFLGLQKLLGKSISVGVDDLTWKLLKPIGTEGFDVEALTEVYSKLNIALDVIHECFEPVKERHTRRDVVEDVIFCRGSDLNRLNFKGFYTVLLERNDEVISVATIRVHGEKVAELPLIGTRFQYRQLGMCRILMNELETKLKELGVERLVLPAAPSVLNTWITSFGFSKMTDSERLRFLDCCFLDFQDTVMCQKPLMKIPSVNSKQLTRAWSKHIIDLISKHGATSESFQSEQVGAEVIDQQPLDSTSSKGGNATRKTDPEHKLGPGETGLECSLKHDNHKSRGIDTGYLKVYKRRRI